MTLLEKEMRIKLIYGVILILAVCFPTKLWAEDAEPSPSPAAAITDPELVKKIDHILENQTQILKQLDELKAELQIVKVRASQR